MKVKTRLVITIIVAVILALLCLRLLLAEATMKYGLILLGVLALAFLVWKAFIQNGQKELRASEEHSEQLQQQVDELKHRLEEMSHSRLNVTGISPILHLSVLQLDTSFTRSYIREDKEHKLTFNGALRTDICAEYGVRLEDVRFKYDDATQTLYLAHFQPGLLSFSKKQMTWDIANSVRERDFFGWIELPPVDDEEAQSFTTRMKEEIRAEVEKEIDERKIAEFEWLSPLITRQVTDVLKLALNKPDAQVSVLEEGQSDENFIDFGNFYQQISDGKPIQ